MKVNDKRANKRIQLECYECIPCSATYDEQEIASLGSEWHNAVGGFNTFETWSQFNKLSHARKCIAVKKLLENSTLMKEVHLAYAYFRDIAFDNDEQESLPAGPLFQFDNGIDPLTWARRPRLVKRYPIVRIKDDEDYLRLDGPWFQFANTTNPLAWATPPLRLIQYPVVIMSYADKMASVGIASQSDTGRLFQYTSREQLDKVVRAYIDRLTRPQCMQQKWIGTPTSHLDRNMLSRHVLDGSRLKMTLRDIEVGCLHRLVVDELPTIINVWIATEVIPTHRYDEIFALDAA